MLMPETFSLGLGVASIFTIVYFLFRVAVAILLVYLAVKLLQIPGHLKRIEDLLRENLELLKLQGGQDRNKLDD